MNTTVNYFLRKWVSKDGKSAEYDIEHKDLLYSTLGSTHHGLQCSHVGGTEKHVKIMSLCEQMTKIAKEIDELNDVK